MKRKRRLEIFAFYDSEGIAAHLNHMAQKGWALQTIGTTFWTYEAIEPENRTYGITFFPDVSAFDTKPTEALQDFIAYCEEAGWHYVTQLSQMQIFYTTNENPIPLETDESLRLEITHKAMKKKFPARHSGTAGTVFVGDLSHRRPHLSGSEPLHRRHFPVPFSCFVYISWPLCPLDLSFLLPLAKKISGGSGSRRYLLTHRQRNAAFCQSHACCDLAVFRGTILQYAPARLRHSVSGGHTGLRLHIGPDFHEHQHTAEKTGIQKCQ